MRHAAIVATGAHLPTDALSNEALIARVGETHRVQIEKLAETTGITRRFIAPDEVATSDLAVAAGRQALGRAGLTPDDLDLILVGTDSPDYITPSTSVIVQHALGAGRAGTFDVGCACASFPTALATAAGLLGSGSYYRHALVIGAYRMSRLADPLDPISFFYGDGAGAAVLSASETPGVLASAMRADGSFAKRWCIASGGTVEPASEASVREGRTQVRLLEPYPREVNEVGWVALAREVAARAGCSLPHIEHFVFTQVRNNTIDTVMDSLGVPRERAIRVMQDIGYTGSACIPMALDALVQRGALRAGEHVLMVGSGVGYNQAAVVVRATEALAGAA